jgi:hypothetical protein
MSSQNISFSFCDTYYYCCIVVSENYGFWIVPFFVSSMIDDTEKLSLMTHFSYCFRNNET